jgi:hypothetical protein
VLADELTTSTRHLLVTKLAPQVLATKFEAVTLELVGGSVLGRFGDSAFVPSFLFHGLPIVLLLLNVALHLIPFAI